MLDEVDLPLDAKLAVLNKSIHYFNVEMIELVEKNIP